MKRIADPQGGMLIAVVIAMMILGAIGAGLAALVSTGARSSAGHSLSIQAFYLAETGFEWAAAELQKSYDNGMQWQDACQALNHDPQPVEDKGYFSVTGSGPANDACQLTVLGWTGGPDPENASASRRLDGGIPKQIITGQTGPGDNIYDDGGNWQGGGANVDFENGAMRLQRPGGQGQGNTNTRANATDILSEDFTSGQMIYFVSGIGWDALPANEEFIIELQMQGQADIECVVQLPSLSSPCTAPSGPLDDPYDLVLELGENINAADINRIIVKIDWGTGATDEVVLENGCIGTEGHCLGNSEPQDPVDDGTWQEG